MSDDNQFAFIGGAAAAFCLEQDDD